ncbi:MAG: DUF1353 domain-containing protein [Desulfobacterales bacterium]|nr:DUF1353 domain-containing protein [Desulfobacterales bacterium]
MKYPQPNICPVPGTRKYLLLDDYKITVGGVDTCVPALFEFDGASIPWYGWHATYTPFHPIVILPSLIHDWHFYNHQVNLQTANDIFYNLLLQNEANEIKARIMYRAVQIGGPSRWEIGEKEKQYLKELHVLVKFRPNYDQYCFPELKAS